MNDSLFILFGIFVLQSFFGTGSSIIKYNILDYCDQRFSMISEDTYGILLYYERDYRVSDGDFECTMEVWGYFDGGGLAMHFTLFNMSDTKTYIEIRQGDSWDEGRPIEGLPDRLSSSTFNELNQVYSSDWMDVFIRVSGEQPPDRKRIFEMAMNHFHTGSCDSWEIRCDNKRCIDKSLKCNGYNPCGDYSDCDETDGLTSGMVAVICVSSITGGSIVLYTVYECCKCYLKRQRQHDTSSPHYSHQQSELYHPYYAHNTTARTTISPRDESDSPESADNAYPFGGPPSYNDVTTPHNVYNDRNKRVGDKRSAPPDYNTAISWNYSQSGANLQPSAPHEPNVEPSVPNEPNFEPSGANVQPNAPSEPNVESSAPIEPNIQTSVPSGANVQSSALSEPYDTHPSGSNINIRASAPSEQVLLDEDELPTYNEVLENEDAYRLSSTEI